MLIQSVVVLLLFAGILSGLDKNGKTEFMLFSYSIICLIKCSVQCRMCGLSHRSTFVVDVYMGVGSDFIVGCFYD